MAGNQVRIIAIVAVLVVAIGGFVIASSGGDDAAPERARTGTGTTQDAVTEDPGNREEPASTTPAPNERAAATNIVVENGQPVGGVRRIRAKKGERVRLVVKSDVADEVHIHGYDLSKDVKAGETVRFGFKADIDGQFEIELEERGEQIASLTVEP